MKDLLFAILLCLFGCGQATQPDSEVNSAVIDGAGLRTSFELGAIFGGEAGVMITAAQAKAGFWETVTGTKPTVGAYLIFGLSFGFTLKFASKQALVTVKTPNGTISGSYCGQKKSLSIGVGAEVGSFRRADGAELRIYGIEEGGGVSIDNGCLLVMGLRV